MTDIIPEVIKVKSSCELGGISLLDSFFIDSNNRAISLKQEGLLDPIRGQLNKLVNKKTIREIISIAKDFPSKEVPRNTPSKHQSKEF